MKQYYRHLGKRKDTFKMLFLLLEQGSRPFYTIVETGVARKSPPDFDGDGASTYMFDEFINYYDGKLISIDIDPKYCEQARQHVTAKTEIICSDSLDALRNISGPIDCLYLDSLDVDWFDPLPAAAHAQKEFELAREKITPGGLVVIDDSPASIPFLPDWVRKRTGAPWPTGKGALLVSDLQKNPSFSQIQHKYQSIFQFSGN